MRLFSITVPTEVDSVSSTGAPPVTSITSVTFPTASEKFSVGDCPTCSSTPARDCP
jgi:hypothetical protein